MATQPITPRPRSDVMPDAEFANLQTFLIGNGLTANQVQTAIGTSVQGRTRDQIETALRGWLVNLPKG